MNEDRRCPKCGSTRWYYWRNFFRCMLCQHTWKDDE